MKLKTVLKILSIPAAIGAASLVLWLENRRPLRRSVESKTVRTGRNLIVAGTAAASAMLAEKPAIDFLTKFVEKNHFGLLKIFKLPTKLETFLAVILLDYTLYLWHVATHKVPFLWRFHLIHHADLDLDASTAYRFHFGEILISVIWRSAQILLIGASPAVVKIWQSLLFPSVLFHHSNIDLSKNFDEKLSRIFVTPRLHGIHHSIVKSETDSNWSSGLTIWDKLHGTLKTDVKQSEIIIGVPAFQNPQDVELERLILLPFEEQKNDWKLIDAN